jgi:ribonuclease HI
VRIYYAPREQVHHFVNQFVADLEQSQIKAEKKKIPPSETVKRWIAPPQGVTKVNVDAAVSKNTGIGSVAAIARDHIGLFLGASALVFPGQMDAETLEALACREGLALASDVYARRVRLASDCQSVFSSLLRGTRGVYAQIAHEIHEQRRSFESLEFCHEKRSSNIEAHVLARSSVLLDNGRCVWLGVPPEGACIPMTFDQ